LLSFYREKQAVSSEKASGKIGTQVNRLVNHHGKKSMENTENMIVKVPIFKGFS